MNAWIFSGGKVVKVEGGSKLFYNPGSTLVAIQTAEGDVIAALTADGDSFVVLSEEQPRGGAMTGGQIA